MMTTPTDPKMLQILEDYRDYDFTRACTDEERRAKLEALKEHSKALEASRAGINAEEVVKNIQKDDEDEGEEEEDVE